MGMSTQLVRSLVVPGFYEATEFLLSEFRQYYCRESVLYRWMCARAVEVIFDRRYISCYLDILNIDDYLVDIAPIIRMLGRMKNVEAKKLILKLLLRDGLPYGVIYACFTALKYYNDIETINYIEPYLCHKELDIRKQAEKTLNSIRAKHK